MTTRVPSLADVFQARRRISSRIRRTPQVRSGWLSDVAGTAVSLKLESLQETCSFKSRGALNAALALRERLAPGAPPPVLVTASAGNHGRGLAWAAEQLGLELVVFTPRHAPATKLDAIRRHGADLRPDASTYEETEVLAKRFSAETGALFISPYSHPDLIAATGTIALEILEDAPDADQIVVPVGGGGLLAGVAAAAKAVKPDVAIVGVEVEASHAFTASRAAGRIVEVAVKPTLADGLAGNMDPDNIAFPIVQAMVDRIVLVGEEALRDGLRGLVTHEHLVAEGAGVVGVAAVLCGRVQPHHHTAVIVSGANIDIEKLTAVLAGA